MGGSTTQTTNSTQTTALPENQQLNVDMLLAGARDLYNRGGPQYFSGQTVAQPNSQILQGRDAATGYASGAGQQFINAYQGGERMFLDPSNIYDPTKIPGYARARQAVQTDATNNLTRNILPQIRAGAVADGGYGGSRQGIAEGLASAETARGVGDILAQMDMNAYNQGLNMYNSAATRAPTSYGLGLAPSSTLQSVGGAYQNDEQRNIDAAMARWQFEQLRPLLNLQSFRDITGTMGQYGGTTTGTQTQEQSGGNPWVQGFGGLLSLGSLLAPGGGNFMSLLGGGK